MTSVLESALNRLVPPRLLHILKQRRTRLVISWALAIIVTIVASQLAWVNCRDGERRDGNWGHVNIDFSGQWLLWAMFVSGDGGHLYDRRFQIPVLEKAYPIDGEKPNQKKRDSKVIFDWLMNAEDKESTLAGPLYPPIHGLLFAPLGLLPPQPAFRVMQGLNLLLTIVAAWLIERLTKGAVWMPIALSLLFLYPGHSGGLHLGQNPIVTMTILLIGWDLLLNGRPLSGGMVWGLLAFKPVWAVAFLLVPLLMRRWRFTAGMVLMGGGLLLATLPFTGLQPWFDWLAIGNLGGTKYSQVRNWIFLSRDLIDIPRRWMLDYDGEWVGGSPFGLWPDVLGVMLWVSVPLTTALVVWRQRGQSAPLVGPGAAFILLGAFFSCYHFMYYDVLLTVLPLTLLFMNPTAYWEEMRAHWGRPPLPLMVLAVLLLAPPIAFHFTPSYLFPPYDEFALLVLWAWCGVQWILAPKELACRSMAPPTIIPVSLDQPRLLQPRESS